MVLNNFAQRALTGFVFVIVMLWCSLHEWSLWPLCLLVFGFSYWEFCKLFVFDKTGSIRWLKALGGLVYTSLPLLMFFNLGFISGGFDYKGDFSPDLPILVLVLTWTNDTFAYLTGRWLGRTPFVPKLSPKKTWEGTIGGFLCAVAMGGFYSYWKLGDIEISYLFFGAVISIAATCGDLFESKLKRLAGVKDSGTLLPGHGGFLDRFDALFFTAPAAYLFLILVG
ncbi:MAG: hypothetical protein EXR21_01840 [Flavobacteriaceae bacterium]|nr:hypothetical protein [Flavobacteriaceae bacterium]